jgi:hypothetical protein
MIAGPDPRTKPALGSGQPNFLIGKIVAAIEFFHRIIETDEFGFNLVGGEAVGLAVRRGSGCWRGADGHSDAQCARRILEKCTTFHGFCPLEIGVWRGNNLGCPAPPDWPCPDCAKQPVHF